MLNFGTPKSADLKLPYGLAEKTTKSKNLQAQAPQADERKPPQEALALQVVISGGR
jgi:hypothetical protein